MNRLLTIITVLILTLSFGVKSHSQINLFGWEINLFGPKQVELFGINGRMSQKEIIKVLKEREITCIQGEGFLYFNCYGKDVTDRYDLTDGQISSFLENEHQMVTISKDGIVFTCLMFDGCSNVTPEEVADELVRSGIIREYEVIVQNEDPLVKEYCYVTDSGAQIDQVCVRGSWFWGEDSIWSKPNIQMDRYSEKDTPRLSFE